MEYHAGRRGVYEKRMEVGKRSSLHSKSNGVKFKPDRKKYLGDVTHDYSNVHGWNLKGKQEDPS